MPPIPTQNQKRIDTSGRSLHLKRNNSKGPGYNVRGYTCSMSSVSHGGRLTYQFDPDPIQLLWGASAQINLLLTRGGQMAYSSGRNLGPLRIVGYLRSRWDQQDLADFVYRHMREFHIKGKPLRFRYPERNIDMSLGIQDFQDIGFDSEQGELVGYSLICQITQDHTALKQADPSQLVPGLPENIEWIDVENAAKIAEKRFGELITIPGSEGGSGESEEVPPDEQEQQPKKKKGPAPLDPNSRLGEERSGTPRFGITPGI